VWTYARAIARVFEHGLVHLPSESNPPPPLLCALRSSVVSILFQIIYLLKYISFNVKSVVIRLYIR